MEVRRDRYLDSLVDRMHNGMIKVITGIRRCGKTYLLFELFGGHLRGELGVDDDHIIEIALDEEANRALRDPGALDAYLRSRIADKASRYYVMLDEVQYAISDNELRRDEPPRLYGVLNGLLRMRNVDVYVTDSNSKLLSTDVMTQFRGRGDEVRVRPLSFSEFMQGFKGDRYQGWAEYVVFGGMPLLLGMRTDEQKSRYLERLFSETYLKDVVARNKVAKTQELEDLVNVLASSIGSLTNPPKIEATFKSVLNSKITANTIPLTSATLRSPSSSKRPADTTSRGASTSAAPRSTTSRMSACATQGWASGRSSRPTSWRTSCTTSCAQGAFRSTSAPSRRPHARAARSCASGSRWTSWRTWAHGATTYSRRCTCRTRRRSARRRHRFARCPIASARSCLCVMW